MLATAQVSRGWDVHIALRRGGVHYLRVREGGVRIHVLGDLRKAHPVLFARLAAVVREVQPQIIHTWLPQMDVVGGVVAIFNRVPWVMSERAVLAAYATMPLLRRTRSWLARFACFVVANSPEGTDEWKQTVSSVDFIGNAVDVAAIDAVDPATAPEVPLLLCVGRLANQKAPEILVQAAAQLAPQKFELLIVGDGPLKTQLVGMIRELELDDCVRLVPYQADWWRFLKVATALISTSRFEGTPNVILEAMAAECPVIVTDIPAHRSILSDTSALFVPTENVAAVAEAISAVLDDPTSARSRAVNARQQVEPLTIASVAERYESVYATCQGAFQRRPPLRADRHQWSARS